MPLQQACSGMGFVLFGRRHRGVLVPDPVEGLHGSKIGIMDGDRIGVGDITRQPAAVPECIVVPDSTALATMDKGAILKCRAWSRRSE